jgi:hypothetical protein
MNKIFLQPYNRMMINTSLFAMIFVVLIMVQSLVDVLIFNKSISFPWNTALAFLYAATFMYMIIVADIRHQFFFDDEQIVIVKPVENKFIQNIVLLKYVGMNEILFLIITIALMFDNYFRFTIIFMIVPLYFIVIGTINWRINQRFVRIEIENIDYVYIEKEESNPSQFHIVTSDIEEYINCEGLSKVHQYYKGLVLKINRDIIYEIIDEVKCLKEKCVNKREVKNMILKEQMRMYSENKKID